MVENRTLFKDPERVKLPDLPVFEHASEEVHPQIEIAAHVEFTHPNSTETDLQEVRASLTESGSATPVERLMEAAVDIPNNPPIEELGTSVTREVLPLHHDNLQKLFDRLDAIKESSGSDRDFKDTLISIRQTIRTEQQLLSRDAVPEADAEYMTFLKNLEAEAALVISKLSDLEGKMFMGRTREEIVFAEYQTKLELRELFPDVDANSLLENPALLERLIAERYAGVNTSIKPMARIKSQLRAIVKGGRSLVAAGIGVGGMGLGSTGIYIASINESINVISVTWSGLPIVAGGVVAAAGVGAFIYERRKSLANDLRNHVKALKEDVWNKWFPREHKPQVETIIK